MALVAINHALLGPMIRLAHGRPLRRAYATLARSASVDLGMALTGASVAVLWLVAPAFTLLAAGPIILILSVLRVPTLEHLSRTDPKTGLYNIADARPRPPPPGEQPFAHIAGDHLITEVARIVGEHAGSDGTAARFGGEEFCLLVRGAGIEARGRAEAIRERVENLHADVEGIPVRATISSRVATFPEHADGAQELLEAADVALYDAKISGRNRVRAAMSPEARAALALPGAGSSAAPQGPRADIGQSAHEETPGESMARRPAPSPARPPGPADATTPTTRAEARHSPRVGWFVAALVSRRSAWPSSPAPIGSPRRPPCSRCSSVPWWRWTASRSTSSTAATSHPARSPPWLSRPPRAARTDRLRDRRRARARRASRAADPLRLRLRRLSLGGAAAAGVYALAGGAGHATVLGAAALAGIVYYGVNIPLLAIVMAASEGRNPLVVWRERLAWLFPQYAVFGLIAAGVVLTEHAVGLYALLIFAVPVLMLLVVERQYVNRARSGVRELARATTRSRRRTPSSGGC